MGKLTLEAKVGAFVILSFIGIGVIATTLEPLKFRGERADQRYFLTFKNVAGLEKDAPVRIAGVTVGKVSSVNMKDGKAIVEIVFFKPVKLYANAKARIETMGLMGEKYIELDPGSPEAPELPPGSKLENTQASVSMDEVMTSLNELIAKFNGALLTPDGKNRLAILMERITQLSESVDRAVNNINSLIEENRKSIGEIVKNLLALSSVLKEELPQVMDNVNTLTSQLSEIALENREDIRKTVINLKLLAERVPKIVERIDGLVIGVERLLNEQNLQNIDEAVENMKEISAELRELLAKVNKGEGTVGKLFNDEELYNSLSKTAKTLGKLADKFEETRTYIGFRGDVNLRTGDSRGVFSLKIVPSADHYYLLEVVGDSQGKLDRKTYYINYGSSVEKREELETDYRTEFTLQYARVFEDRWIHPGGKFVLRGGLKESTGGVGLDYLYSDRLTFFSDLWDTGRKDKNGEDIEPHLRVGIKYRLGDNWFIYGGGDELLYSKWRGFFVGAGVMFGDDDIKYLLGSLPGGIK
ncbi:MlaD family protein [Phorcysia thermohydrogeniphila]|uniref:Phospholipid/cholesterol/gamma-HCH transport system substrate-binding protein n=1 Tax=Phorcysia thermohydrogeniphila TaxID=936138 RepID=A0A4R1GBZ0_9BACT|nr:MlaD family protein [Phorcysia thermohydrogeniphila]TCK05318.1 phospholipid/cholesterol/gamma-HCH transport system substrate-binding protein [Phorcysia thermohydrogeniphila]TCK05328.1 phospholipid/cholesterol/gamma-HCH transport system substrate-binding protein [Phorcysia thermohydrogeniphila]